MNTGSSMPAKEFDLHYAREQLRRSRNPFRRFVKAFYLRHILRGVRGPTIDFGCGAGQLLKRLPKGSIGLEVNPHLIESLRRTGLQVHQARADIQDFDLPDFLVGVHKTLVIAHVLEHLPAPRRFVWKETVKIAGRRRARWACGQAAFEPVHMSTGRFSGAWN